MRAWIGGVQHYDAIVVGAGPAGRTAALWLGRYRRRTLVVDSGEPRNRWVDVVHGTLAGDVEPGWLASAGRAALTRYETVTLAHGRVTGVDGALGRFGVAFDGQRLTARRLVLATGVRDVFPDIDAFFRHYGADVFHCPACDGFEARDRHVAVFGWGEHVTGFALELLDWARSVVVVTDGHALDGGAAHGAVLERNGIHVRRDAAVAFVGERGRLEGVRLRGGDLVACELAFFSIAHEPVNGLARQLGCRLHGDGYVLVDGDGQTSVPGVYAAGDLVPGLQLVTVAAGQGAVAGTACALSLRGEPPVPGAPVPAPDPQREVDGSA